MLDRAKKTYQEKRESLLLKNNPDWEEKAAAETTITQPEPTPTPASTPSNPWGDLQQGLIKIGGDLQQGLIKIGGDLQQSIIKSEERDRKNAEAVVKVAEDGFNKDTQLMKTLIEKDKQQFDNAANTIKKTISDVGEGVSSAIPILLIGGGVILAGALILGRK